MIKPDVAIYKKFLEEYRLSADECLFIDDRADNIAGAKAAGFNVFQFMGNYDEVFEKVLNAGN